MHNEDYRVPLRFYPVCKQCHAALHARFDDPARWVRVLQLHNRPMAWFTLLTLETKSQWTPFDVTYPADLPLPDVSQTD